MYGIVFFDGATNKFIALLILGGGKGDSKGRLGRGILSYKKHSVCSLQDLVSSLGHSSTEVGKGRIDFTVHLLFEFLKKASLARQAS